MGEDSLEPASASVCSLSFIHSVRTRLVPALVRPAHPAAACGVLLACIERGVVHSGSYLRFYVRLSVLATPIPRADLFVQAAVVKEQHNKGESEGARERRRKESRMSG